MDPRTPEHQTRRFNEIREDKLEQVNEWLLSMERPKVSDEDREWSANYSAMYKGRFRWNFIQENYLGEIGDGSTIAPFNPYPIGDCYSCPGCGAIMRSGYCQTCGKITVKEEARA